MQAFDPYQVLEVSRDASQDRIKRQFRRLVRRYHPDHNPGDPEAEERFKDIAKAYDLIGDPERRRQFDAGIMDHRRTQIFNLVIDDLMEGLAADAMHRRQMYVLTLLPALLLLGLVVLVVVLSI